MINEGNIIKLNRGFKVFTDIINADSSLTTICGEIGVDSDYPEGFYFVDDVKIADKDKPSECIYVLCHKIDSDRKNNIYFYITSKSQGEKLHSVEEQVNAQENKIIGVENIKAYKNLQSKETSIGFEDYIRWVEEIVTSYGSEIDYFAWLEIKKKAYENYNK